MKAFDFIRLGIFLIGGVIGLVFLTKGCSDKQALRTSAQEDFLVLTSIFEKKVSRGRFQSPGKELYVHGFVKSSGSYHEMPASDACRHTNCSGVKTNLSSWRNKQADTIQYQVPIWSANAGRAIALRKPGDKTVNMKKADGKIYGGLLLVGMIAIPLMLWLAFGNGKLV